MMSFKGCECHESLGSFLGLDVLSPEEEILNGLEDAEPLCGLSGKKKTSNPYDIILYKFLDAIQKQGLKWVRSWAVVKINPPMNYKSKRKYNGINAWLLGGHLSSSGKYNPYFLTRKQVKELGGKIKKKASPFPVFFWSNKGKKEEKVKRYSDGRKVIGEPEPGKKVTEKVETVYYSFLRYFLVFHADDITGIDWGRIEKPEQLTRSNAEKIETAEEILKSMPKRPDIIHKDPNRAFYRPSDDIVNMPKLAQFSQDQEYYGTLFHELIHSTAHRTRIGREMGGRFGDKKYAFEELIAEIGGAYLCGEAGILNFTFENSAAYLQGWQNNLKKQVKEDKNFIIKAAKQAEDAVEFILGRKAGSVRSKNNKSKKPDTVKNHIINFISLHGEEVAVSMIAALVRDIQKDIKAKKITKESALADEIKTIQQKLVKAYNHAVDEGNEEIRININSKDLERLRSIVSQKELAGIPKGISISHNEERNGIEVKFEAKPNPHIRDWLNANKFRWNPVKKLWYITYTDKMWGIVNSFFSDLGDCDQFQGLGGTPENFIPYKGYEIHISKWNGASKLIDADGSVKNMKPMKAFFVSVYKDGDYKMAIKGPVAPYEKALEEGMSLVEMSIGIDKKKGLSGADKAPKCLEEKPKRIERLSSPGGLNGADGEPAPEITGEEDGEDEFGFVRADKKNLVKTAKTNQLPTEVGKFLQDLQPYKLLILLTGDPHAGKTEMSTQIMNAFAEDKKNIAAFFLEQGGMESKDTRGAIDRNVTPKNQQKMFITGVAKNGLATIKKAATLYDVVFIDSWQKLKLPNTVMDDLRHEFPDTIFIIVFQQNSEGKTRGGVAADYDAPLKIKVHKVDSTFVNNYAELEKNRGNSLNWHYMIHEKKCYPGNRPGIKKEEAKKEETVKE